MKKLVLILLGLCLWASAGAQSSTLRKKQFNQTNSVAIDGYDPVAYFTKHRAVKGLKTIAYTSLGVTYYFSSTEHKKMFMKNHAKYEPQYGGWCASAMSETGSKAQIDPNSFKIIDGKLYLFCQPQSSYSKSAWGKTGIVKADKNWGEQNK